MALKTSAAEREARRERRKAKRRERARAELVEAARQVMAEQGLAAITVDAVAERVGLSKAAVYYYFSDKEALIRGLLAEDQLRVARLLRERVEVGPTGPEALGAFVRAVVVAYLGDLESYRLQQLWPQIIGSEPGVLETTVNPAMTELFDLVEARLRQGEVAAGTHGRRAVFLAWTSALGLVQTLSLLDAMDFGSNHSTESLVDDLAAMVVRGVSP